jgi:hypothetical protein
VKSKEPAVIGTALAAVINLIVLLVFDHELSEEQTVAIVSVVTIAAGLFVRSKVTPTG